MNDGGLDDRINRRCVYTVVTSCFQDGAVIETRPVPKHVSSLDFLNLVPGHAYTVTIQSLSGKLNNSNTATGRTGETLVKIQMDSDELMLIIIDYCVCVEPSSSGQSHGPAGG